MKLLIPTIVLGTLISMSACDNKKSDTELFQSSPVRLSLSSNVRKGYEPLLVEFSAYLETDDDLASDKITEIKWEITGPGGYKDEFIQQTYNYQDEEENENDFFHFERDFRIPGKYRIQLILNDGKYKSNPYSIDVWQRPENR